MSQACDSSSNMNLTREQFNKNIQTSVVLCDLRDLWFEDVRRQELARTDKPWTPEIWAERLAEVKAGCYWFDIEVEPIRSITDLLDAIDKLRAARK
jgi:hypothetical protein